MMLPIVRKGLRREVKIIIKYPLWIQYSWLFMGWLTRFCIWVTQSSIAETWSLQNSELILFMCHMILHMGDAIGLLRPDYCKIQIFQFVFKIVVSTCFHNYSWKSSTQTK